MCRGSDTLKLIWRGQYYPDTKAIQGQHKSHRPTNISVEHQWENSQQNFRKLNSRAHWEDHSQWSKGSEFIPGIQGWFNIYKSINTICLINTIKDKKCMILIDAGKAFEIIKHSKTLKKNWIPGP